MKRRHRHWPSACIIVCLFACQGADNSTSMDLGTSDWNNSHTLSPTVGQPCSVDADCLEGTCLLPTEGFPAGYCTVTDCRTAQSCGDNGTVCLAGLTNRDICGQSCLNDSDCRPQYRCHADLESACLPPRYSDALSPVCHEAGGTEGETTHISFEIPEDTTGFIVHPYSQRSALSPLVLTAPSGHELELLEDYDFFMETGLSLQNIWPIMLPAGPVWSDWVQAGEYTLALTGEAPCHYVLSNEVAGEQLDLNFYFVTQEFIHSDNAAENVDFQSMLDTAASLLALADIEVGVVRYFNLEGEVATANALPGNLSEIDALLSLTWSPGSTLRDQLSLDIIVVEEMLGEIAGTLGTSGGIPGPVGVHGHHGAGLVLTTSNLGNATGNRLIGQVLAHEIGHYLGLEHTSEINGFGDGDRLDDTPLCTEMTSSNLADCPDANNLMFPVSVYLDEILMTDDQIMVLRSNPVLNESE